MYADGAGLYLRVTQEGTKSWVFRFMLDGRPRWMGLGPVSLIGLHEVRGKALDACRLHHQRLRTARERRPSSNVLSAALRRTALAGGTPSMRRNGRQRLPPMPSRRESVDDPSGTHEVRQETPLF